MIISILGIVAEMERKQIKERQKEGIELAKLRGVYKGRVHGSKEDLRTFLSKPKIAKNNYEGEEDGGLVFDTAD